MTENNENNENDENIENIENGKNEQIEFESLHIRVKKHASAHRKCRTINTRFHSVINILMLICSAAVTSLESLLDITKNDYEVQVVKITLSGMITFLASLNTLYNNGEKAAIHDSCSKSYTNLAYKIEAHIHDISNNQTIPIQNYSDFLKEFAKVKSEAIGIFGCVRKQLKIE